VRYDSSGDGRASPKGKIDRGTSPRDRHGSMGSVASNHVGLLDSSVTPVGKRPASRGQSAPVMSSALQNPDRLALRAAADRALQGDFVLGIGGDAVAYRRFLGALLDLLRAYFRHRLTGVEDVEDLVQEAVFAIHDRRHTFSGHVPITAWIHAIARYKLMDWLREHAAERDERVELDDDVPLLTYGHRTWEVHYDLQRLLQELPEKQRRAIMHVRIWGSSVREAAMQMGITESDVKVSVHRGLKALSLYVLEYRHAP
jgi:RNA polymerase sigma-70 factor (ECF subfamily)